MEATSTVEISAAVPQEVPPAESQGSQMDVSVQIEAIPEGGKTSSGDSEEERLKDCFIQLTIAPKLTAVRQQRLHQEGIYLVVATKVEDNLFITQLVHDTLTLKQQVDICQRDGEILITHNPDDYEAAHMNFDPQWLQQQIRLQNERQENLPLRVFEEIPEGLQMMQQHLREETNVTVAADEEVIEEPEIDEEDMELEEEIEEGDENEEASIREMLNVMGEIPHMLRYQNRGK